MSDCHPKMSVKFIFLPYKMVLSPLKNLFARDATVAVLENPKNTKQSRSKFVILLFATCVLLFTAAVVVKWTVGDDESEVLKLALVSVNALIVLSISASNFDNISQRKLLLSALFSLFTCIFACFVVSIYLLSLEFQDIDG
jgi:hypothetical protein